jgi:hypothetical protein
MAASSILGVHPAGGWRGTGTAPRNIDLENFGGKFRNGARVRENRDECMRIFRAATINECKVSES